MNLRRDVGHAQAVNVRAGQRVDETMSQLWWTSSGGYYGVRAASTGLADDARFRRLEPFVKYALPANASLHRVTPASAPRTLALIAAGEERVLVNKVFVGKDDVGRAGIVFSHLVADLPEDFLAGDAIQLWRSDFWRKSDGTLPAAERTLPPVPRQDLGARGPLDEAELRNRLQDDNLRSSLEFVIQAVLGGDVGRRIYIAAPCDDVALLILGLTLCLPRRLQTALTFSTYESDVSIAFTRLVGTCQPLPHEALVPGPFDLPAACYRAGYAVNCYAPTPKMSSLGSEERAFEAFARFAADQLAGDPSSLRELLCIAEEDEIDRPRDLLALARLWLATRADSGERSDILGGERQGETGRAPTRGAPKGADRIDSTSMAAALTVSEEDLGLILGSRTLARELLPLDEVQEALVAMLASGSAWWAGRGRDGLAKLTRDRAFDPVRRQIARRALERATMELQRDGVERAQRLIEELAGFDQPVGSRAWASLLLDLTRLCGDHAPSAYYDWRIYTFVLERCARDPFCSQDDAAAQALSRWLAVGWQGIPRFLGLELPRELVARCLTQALLRPDAVPAAIGPLVDEHAEEFSAALASALREPGGDEAVRRFFDALRGQRCRSRALLMAGLPSDVYGDQHPPSGASRSRAATMAGRSTAIPAGGAPLVGALAPSRSEALLTIRRFCRSPQLGKDELRELALGLRVLAPDGDALQRQRAALLPVLIATARDKREIEDVLETLGEVLMGSPLALLRVILYGLDSSELADPGVAAPYLEVALDDRARCWHIPWATAFEDRARLVRPLLTATLVKRLDRAVRSWNRPAQENWQVLADELPRRSSAPRAGLTERHAQEGARSAPWGSAEVQSGPSVHARGARDHSAEPATPGRSPAAGREGSILARSSATTSGRHSAPATTRCVALLHVRVDEVLSGDEIARYAEEDYVVEMVSRYLSHLDISEPAVLRVDYREARTEEERLAIVRFVERLLHSRLRDRFVRPSRKGGAEDGRDDPAASFELIVLRWD